jgi:2-C-methyl-D-erythritol 4-phosphate cytidylyltransferase
MIVKVQVIIPTAGIGVRLKTSRPKPFVEIHGKPLCVHALEVFEQSPVVDSMIIVGHADNFFEFERIVKKYRLTKVAKIVPGGETRCTSVSNGLAMLDDDTDVVIVHDGARPLVCAQTVEDAVKLMKDHEAVVTAVPVKSTIKRVDPNGRWIEATLDREKLWEAQTPQVFRKKILLRAHAQNKDRNPTDDAVMVERLGVKVKVLAGDYRNIKITTQEDLTVAEAFFKTKKD